MFYNRLTTDLFAEITSKHKSCLSKFPHAYVKNTTVNEKETFLNKFNVIKKEQNVA